MYILHYLLSFLTELSVITTGSYYYVRNTQFWSCKWLCRLGTRWLSFVL